jgi:UDPglucose 6-dehydrogenase
MKIAVLGLWHLGSVTAACTAASGVATIGIDDDADWIASLSQGKAPLYEPGLDDILGAELKRGTLQFTSDIAAVAEADVLWVCHDTPVDDDDRADIDYVMGRVRDAFPYLKDGAVVLVSAQLPVGSVAALEMDFAVKRPSHTVSFACSPENLRLGCAIDIFRNPGWIVIGVRDQYSHAVLEPLLRRFCEKLIWMSVESAEMVKHAINAFLATSITLTNEIATVAEHVGANAAEIEVALRSEPRIGAHAYVKAGPSFAGGTLARDVNFLGTLAKAHHVEVPVLNGVLLSNRAHGAWAYSQLRRRLSPLAGRTIAILGLAYKPGTSTLRRSTAIELINNLVKDGAHVAAFDPKVTMLPTSLATHVRLADNAKDAVRNADAVVLATEWPEFRTLSGDELADLMAGDTVLDAGRFLGETVVQNRRLSLISVGRIS